MKMRVQLKPTNKQAKEKKNPINQIAWGEGLRWGVGAPTAYLSFYPLFPSFPGKSFFLLQTCTLSLEEKILYCIWNLRVPFSFGGVLMASGGSY